MQRTYDIRGTVPDEINPTVAIFLAKKFSAFLKQKKYPAHIILASDKRKSSPQLLYAFKKAFEGKVEEIGYTPTPVFYHEVLKANIPGAMITASHLPPKFNGFKCYLPNNNMWIFKGEFPKNIPAPMRLVVPPKEQPRVQKEILLAYLQQLKKYVSLKGKHTLSFSSTSSLNADLISLLPKVFPNISLSKKADWNITSDYDGDRVFVSYKRKLLLPEDVFFILLQNSAYRKIGIPKNVSASLVKAFPQKQFSFIKTGHKNFKDAYNKKHLDFAMEYSHHIYFFKELKTEAPLLMPLKLLEFSQKHDIAKHLKNHPFFVKRYDVMLKNSNAHTAIAEFSRLWEKNFSVTIKQFDGYEITIRDKKTYVGRIHIRTSNTEKKIVRVCIDAPTRPYFLYLKRETSQWLKKNS